MAAEFTGIVLAGGRSSRMGRDKALLPWGSKTLLDRMVDVLTAAGAARVLVSGDRPAYRGVVDTRPGLGPVGGLHAVAVHVHGPAVVVPVDLPCLRPASIHRLLEGLSGSAAAYFEGHPLPCALEIDAALRATLERLVDGADGVPVMRLHTAVGSIALPVGGAVDELLPCNTPAQWQALRR